MKYLILSAFTIMVLSCINCGESEGPNGKINITLEANDPFKSGNPDPTTTRVIWGCVVLSENQTACMYYFNGSLQTDSNISHEAAEAGPESNEITFVAPGTVFSAQDGGERIYSFYNALYNNSDASVIGDIENISGPLDLYSNPGKDGKAGDDNNWIVSFGSSGAPSVNIGVN